MQIYTLSQKMVRSGAKSFFSKLTIQILKPKANLNTLENLLPSIKPRTFTN